MKEHFGFNIEVKDSSIKDAGRGVFVKDGVVPKFSITSLYPGWDYYCSYFCLIDVNIIGRLTKQINIDYLLKIFLFNNIWGKFDDVKRFFNFVSWMVVGYKIMAECTNFHTKPFI